MCVLTIISQYSYIACKYCLDVKLHGRECFTGTSFSITEGHIIRDLYFHLCMWAYLIFVVSVNIFNI